MADIVFVHGLAGGSHSTWRYGKQGEDEYFFWPGELGRNFGNCGVWSFGYAAGFTELGNPGMIIQKRAGNMARQLINSGLGRRPVIFIAHSMGGLVVKSLIVSSQLSADRTRSQLVEQIHGIVFCATPHRGSDLAAAARVLTLFLGGSQAHLREMAANAEPLDLLHDQFLEWHRRNPISVESYVESIGLFRKRWYWRAVPLGMVVPRASANSGIGVIHDVDADHLTLVKPCPQVQAIYGIVYKGVNSFVGRVIETQSSLQQGLRSTSSDPSRIRALLLEILHEEGLLPLSSKS